MEKGIGERDWGKGKQESKIGKMQTCKRNSMYANEPFWNHAHTESLQLKANSIDKI